MIIPIALALLSIQPSAPDSGRRQPAVRVWLSDTILDLGKVAQVYVRPRFTGYLAVLHADAEGHIRVLYPVAPTDQVPVSAGATFQVSSGVAGRSFSVNAKGTGMVLAAWSATPFRFDDLRWRDQWDYENALLLQPSAGNAFAALLDIADRIADEQPYGYDLAVYGTPGAKAVRPTAPPPPCRDCLTKHYVSHPSTDNAVATSTYAVDCSNTTLVDSFCGVADNRVYYSYVDQSQNYQDQSQATSYPYPMAYDYPLYYDDYGYGYGYGSYYPSYGHGGRFRGGHGGSRRATTPAQSYIRPLGLQQAPGSTSPPATRTRPTITVRQPYAPSHPDRLAVDPASETAQPGPAGQGDVPSPRRGESGAGPGRPMPGGGQEQPGGAWGGFVGAPAGHQERGTASFGYRIPPPFGNTIPQPFGNRIAQPFGGGFSPSLQPVMSLPARGGGRR